MNFQYFKPSAVLSPFIRYYWLLEADSSEGIVTERVIPTGNIELMFHFKNSFLVKQSIGNHSFFQPQSFISGIKSSFDDVSTRGESGMIAVTFYPLGACHFFGFPLDEIQNQLINLDCICSQDFRNIEEQLNSRISNLERIRIIERFLIKRISPILKSDFNLLKQAILIINQSGGNCNVEELSAKLSTTTRSLERKFTRYVGKSPKQYSKIVRFQQVLNSFNLSTENNLAQIAYDHGYFDQAHFIRDFKTFSGYSPKDYLTYYRCS